MRNQAVLAQRFTIPKLKIVAVSIEETRVGELLLVLSQKSSRKTSILLVYLPIPLTNPNLVPLDSRNDTTIPLVLFVLKGHLVVFLVGE